MRDQFAPMIEGFDLNGIVDPYSFQCTPFYIEGDNGGTLMDGTTIHDILEEKVRLSWTFNALYLNQYIALSDALNSGESPDTVTAYAYDLTRNAVILAKFHASLPEFNFVSAYGQTMALANGELVLEEAELIAWFVVTPPTRTTYGRGETLDLTGLTVTQYDKDGNGTNITAQCAISTVDEVELLTEGDMAVPVLVTLPSGFELIFDWNITVSSIIASGDGWTFYNNGLFDVYCVGDMPNYSMGPTPWEQYKDRITKVVLGDSVTSIGYYAFAGCTKLASVLIPNSVIKIGYSAFSGCTKLASVLIPNSVTSIEDYAFANCTKLASVIIPDSVTKIGYEAFRMCNSLTSVMIGENVATIGMNAFANCRNLENIEIKSNNNAYSVEDGVLFNKSKTKLVYYPTGKQYATYTLPTGVIEIEENAFSYCKNITKLRISDTVTKIKTYACYGCENLTAVIIPVSVTSIGKYAFYPCKKLASVYYSGTREEAERNLRSSALFTKAGVWWYYNTTGPDF